jgi:hypothetical protein
VEISNRSALSRVGRVVAAAVLAFPLAALWIWAGWDPGGGLFRYYFLHFVYQKHIGVEYFARMVKIGFGIDFVVCFAFWYWALGFSKYARKASVVKQPDVGRQM